MVMKIGYFPYGGMGEFSMPPISAFYGGRRFFMPSMPMFYGMGNCFPSTFPPFFSSGRDYTSLGAADGQKTVLEIVYSSLITDLNSLIAKTKSKMEDNKLSQEQIAKYSEFNTKAQELLQKTKDYGMHSSNIAIASALNTVNGYYNEYYAMAKEEIDFETSIINKTIQGKTQDNKKPDDEQPVESQNKPQTETPENNPSKPEATGQKPAQPEEKPVQSEEKPEEPEEPEQTDEEKIAQIENNYNTDLKPHIEEQLNSPYITDVDKNTLEEKQKEIEQAIKDKESPEDLNDLYNDLDTLISEIDNRISIEKNLRQTQELFMLKTNSKTTISDARKYRTKNKLYINRKDNLKLIDNIKKLEEAIINNKPLDEIKSLYIDLEYQYNDIKKNTDKIIKDTDKICNDIHSNADGADLSFVVSTNEKNIIAAINKINKTNIKGVLNRWNEKYKFNNENLLETISGEFLINRGVYEQLCNHITTAVTEYAKDNGIYDKIKNDIDTIVKNAVFTDKSQAYNNILKVINDIDPEKPNTKKTTEKSKIVDNKYFFNTQKEKYNFPYSSSLNKENGFLNEWRV